MQTNISLENYDSTLIAAISNQVLKTVFTKDKTKIKLKTKFLNSNVVYKLETNNTSFVLNDNILEVVRNSQNEETAKISVYLLDNSNEVYVNSWDLVLLTKDNSETYKLQEMRYNNNKISYLFGILGILFVLFAGIVLLNSVRYNWQSLVYILLLIAMVLVGFLASEKVKTYQINYSYVMGVLGIICVLLIFWYPLSLIVQYGRYQEASDMLASMDATNPEYAHWQEILQDTRNYLGAPIVETNVVRQAMLPTSGTFRGVFAIILLVIAAASNFVGSFVAYVKSKKLNKYLESLNK